MTTATETKTTTAPPEPAPQREWQVGDRITGINHQGKPFQGAVIGVGLTYIKCHNYPTRMADAVLVTPADAVVMPPAPFAPGDLVRHKGQDWQVKTIQQLDWLGWHVDLLETDALPGDWSVDWIEWACDEPCPAAAVAPAITPPAFDSEPFESVEHYLGSAILWQENEEFITPDDGTPIGYRGWQIITDSHAGTLASFSVQTPEGDWYSGLCLNDGPLSGLDHQQAIAYAKATIDNAIALAEKLSGQMSLLEQPAVEAQIVATEPAARLAELEADIDTGLTLINDGIKSIWAAATSIRQERLWEQTGHASYVAYCQERWGWGKATAHEHAVAGSVLSSLLLSGVPVEEIPDSTRAMMELGKVEPEQRPTVLAEAAASNGGRATAKAVREVAQPKPDAEAELRAAGIPVCKPDTSAAAIKMGLDSGYLRPTTEQPPSPTAAAHADASPDENALSGAETPAPFDEALKDLLEPGRFVRVANHPGVWYFAQLSPDGQNAMVWSRNGRHLAPLSDLSLNQFCDSASLNRVALDWLSELVSVLGPEQVQALLGEVSA